jgi:sporulation protein YlmC with PRC-barrel domain
MKTHSENIVRSTEIIGVPVKNAESEDIGKIEEIVLDKIEGHVRYVVLSFGGILGLGDKYFALPWKSISYCKDRKAFILEIDKNKLKEENGFDKNNWPDMAKWPESIDAFYAP